MNQVALKNITINTNSGTPALNVDKAFLPYWNKRTNKEAVANWLVTSHDTQFGRLALSAALDACFASKLQDSGPRLEKWKVNAKASKKLAIAISHFVNCVSDKDWPLDEAINQIMRAHFYQKRLSNEQPETMTHNQNIKRYSEALLTTHHFAQLAENVTATYVQSLSTNRQNIGIPETRAFATIFVEAYVFLYAQTPALNNTAFQGAVEDAWSDICDAEQNWEHPLRVAIEKLNDGELSFIAENGPSWVVRPHS